MGVEQIIANGEKYIQEAQALEPLEDSCLDEKIEEVKDKYILALRQFETVLDIEPDNEVAVEGFAYALCKLDMYYRKGNLAGLALLLITTKCHRFKEEHLSFLDKSERLRSDFRLPFK